MSTKWDRRAIDMAALVASWSKDPSTKVGAVIMRPDKTIASVGYNGLPQGVADDERLEDKGWKHAVVRHAEENAIAFAREPLHGYTLAVTPLHPCSRCAGAITQAGIARVVYTMPVERQDWSRSGMIAVDLLREANVEVSEVV